MAEPAAPTYTWTGMADVVSGSIAQPATRTPPGTAVTVSSEPTGGPDGWVTVRQPRASRAAPPALRQIRWVPGATGTTPMKPAVGVADGIRALTSGRATDVAS